MNQGHKGEPHNFNSRATESVQGEGGRQGSREMEFQFFYLEIYTLQLPEIKIGKS